MSSPVRDAIAAELATLEREVDAPTAPFGYGLDLSLVEDLMPTMEVTDPNATLGVAEAIVRRLDCQRGGLPDDADYGIDLRGMCNTPATTATLRQLAGVVRAEVTKDDRIERAEVTVAPSSTGDTLRFALRLTPVDPSIGTFSMTIAVTSAEILLEEIKT